ncbi:hypothetical protein I7I53_02007 [Histoplasma capsulatum var. duboisii H88]|uniref:Uncharacterized protein n=1 Tax=Ajellomyces capsulatus (strain H88) TaxID=544711 RepID=A0A8A1LLX5_AJEC8|nr:hypothetical protein I7I53_02007 [Histoplasma capsulatum var. duboisii H88]
MSIHIGPCTQSIHSVNLATQRVVLQSANIHTCEGSIPNVMTEWFFSAGGVNTYLFTQMHHSTWKALYPTKSSHDFVSSSGTWGN